MSPHGSTRTELSSLAANRSHRQPVGTETDDAAFTSLNHDSTRIFLTGLLPERLSSTRLPRSRPGVSSRPALVKGSPS